MPMKNKQNRTQLTATFTFMAASMLIASGCDQNTSKLNNSPDAPITASSATNAVQKRIAAIIQEQFGRKEEVTPNLRIVEDLKGDSLDAVELVMAIEEEFHIEIADEAAEKMKTVGDVITYVEKAVDSKRQ
jgi:acyl carrier protein